MASEKITLAGMRKEDVPGAVELIRAAMNEEEADWACRSMQYHFECVEKNLDDGRHYFVWQKNSKVLGVVGLHHYNWGPKENVWLGWFALEPKLHGAGAGSRLLDEVICHAENMGFRKVFIETYTSPTFAKARKFYERKGFKKAGRIDNYLPDGSAMVVYLKIL